MRTEAFHLTYKDLIAKHQSDVSYDSIKKTAAEICQRRAEYACAIPLSEIKKKVTEGKSLVGMIKTMLPKSKETINIGVREKCHKLENTLNEYLDETQKLQKRFQNKKIKIVVFGSKSNGKSTFIQLFTGLDEKVVAVKAPGKDLDMTGATNIISHRSGVDRQTPKITILFKSTNELLQELNNSIEQLSACLSESIPDLHTFMTWSDFIDSRARHGAKWYEQITSLSNKAIPGFTTKKNTLAHFFEEETSFSMAKTEEYVKSDIPVKDLPKYNDMNNHGERHYLSVKDIRISLDLGYNGVFELFDICDTRGLSTESGSEYEPLLYKQINDSDAAFCVQKVASGAKASEFFSGLADKTLLEDGPKDLNKKLFAVLNKQDGIELKSVSQVIGTIRDNNLAAGIYEGSLAREITSTNTEQHPYKEDDGTEINAEIFANNVMIDMLHEIVETTKEMDDMLWDNVSRTLPRNIEAAVRQLRAEMDYSKIHVPVGLDVILTNKIHDFRTTAAKEIQEIAKSEDIAEAVSGRLSPSSTINEEETFKLSATNKDQVAIQFGTSTPKVKQNTIAKPPTPTNNILGEEATLIYKIIVGVDEDSSVPKEIASMNDPEQVVKNALDTVSEQIKEKIGTRVKITSRETNVESIILGDVQTIGSFVDDYAALLYDSIVPRINQKYAPAQEIKEYRLFCDRILNTVWKAFKLDIVIGPITSGEDLKKYIDIQRIQVWYNFWNEPTYDDSSDRLPPIYSFDILRAFFAGNVTLSADDVTQLRPIFESEDMAWQSLKDAAFNVYKSFNFKHIVEQKIADIKGHKAKACQSFMSNLPQGKIEQDFIPLFKKLPIEKLCKDNILTKEEVNEIKEADNMDKLIAKRDELQQITNLPQWQKPQII